MFDGQAREWLVVFAFVVAWLALTLAEAFWLNKKGWANFGKSIAFAAATNFIGYAVGLFVLFAAAMVVFMLIFGNDGTGGGEGANPYILTAVVFGLLFLPVFLALCKRIFLKIMKMQAGGAAWIFAWVSAFTTALVSFGAPILLGYLIF